MKPAYSTAISILRLVFRFRRSLPSNEHCWEAPCDSCFSPHLEKMALSISRDLPIPFILPAFPAKSPNRRKVLGVLPDLAETLALSFLQSLCEQIAHFHPPGAQLSICSDGRVFSDLVGVEDSDVTLYRAALEALATDLGAHSIRFFSLDDVFGSLDYSEMRRQLSLRYAQPLETLRQKVRAEQPVQSLFNGIHRFMFEDQPPSSNESRNKKRELAKERAYQVIQRSNAWSDLLQERFPESIRLSIHPQPFHSPKLGIHLVASPDCWLTPWHSAVLDTGAHQRLIHRAEAERLGASLVLRKGRPSHFVAPHLYLE